MEGNALKPHVGQGRGPSSCSRHPFTPANPYSPPGILNRPSRSRRLFQSERHRHFSWLQPNYGISVNDRWFYVDSEAGAPAWNMAFDEALLTVAAEIDRPVLRFYAWTEPAATFGYFQRFGEVAVLTRLRPLIRRPTGGGLVRHDDDWTYSVVVPPSHAWYELSAVASYQRMHEWLRRSLAQCEIATDLAPDGNPAGPGQCFVGAEKYDLLFHREKIAGAAQRRNRLGLLIQGSLQPPPRHLPRNRWQEAMLRVGPDGAPRSFESLPTTPSLSSHTVRLQSERYGTTAYNERR